LYWARWRSLRNRSERKSEPVKLRIHYMEGGNQQESEIVESETNMFHPCTQRMFFHFQKCPQADVDCTIAQHCFVNRPTGHNRSRRHVLRVQDVVGGPARMIHPAIEIRAEAQ